MTPEEAKHWLAMAAPELQVIRLNRPRHFDYLWELTVKIPKCDETLTVTFGERRDGDETALRKMLPRLLRHLQAEGQERKVWKSVAARLRAP